MSNGRTNRSYHLCQLLAGLLALTIAALLLSRSSEPPASGDVFAPRLGAAPLPADDTTLTRIAFGSCVHQGYPQPIWAAIRLAQPQLFLLIGDNVYGDVKSAELAELKLAYSQQANHPDFAAARRDLPMLATWDDHDYGANDAGGDFPHRAATAALFRSFWGLAADPQSADGIYAAHTFGPEGKRVQIILLDSRSFRSPLRDRPKDAPGKGRYDPDPDPAKTMLGSRQWAWLEEQLRQPAELRLIVSSIQVIAEGHSWERWGNLPLEQARLYELADRTGARGLVFLSGDRHLGAIYRRDDGRARPLYDFTSSSLNRPNPASGEPGPHRLSDVFGLENFGLISVDWDKRLIRLELRDVVGHTVVQQDIAFVDQPSR